ncbi:MAG: sugar ABC transporter substrate-binding protein, partial [Cyanobium sp.]
MIRSFFRCASRLSLRRRSWTVAALGMVLLASLAGCRGHAPGAGAGSGREISVWTLDLAPRFSPYLQGVIRRWEARHPGVKVRWTDVPWSSVERKL